MSAESAPAPGSLAALCSLQGRVALVAGGSGGIGHAVCRVLLEVGARVASLDRSVEGAAPGTHAVACDLTDPEAVERTVAGVLAQHGRLDLAVHCVGVTRDALSWKLSVADWRAVIATNLDSAFFLLRNVVPALRDAGGGSLVFVSSINGERGKVGQSNYSASKGGLNALARAAAREVGRFGIRVNVVAPGWIDTPMTARLPDELRQRALGETALGRLGRPDDVAHAILFLGSGLGNHVTGQVLRVDGGQWIG